MKNMIIERALKPTRNWSAVCRMFKGSTVATGHNCGRIIIIELGGQHWKIHDGAHNDYMYFHIRPEDVQAEIKSIGR